MKVLNRFNYTSCELIETYNYELYSYINKKKEDNLNFFPKFNSKVIKTSCYKLKPINRFHYIFLRKQLRHMNMRYVSYNNQKKEDNKKTIFKIYFGGH